MVLELIDDEVPNNNRTLYEDTPNIEKNDDKDAHTDDDDEDDDCEEPRSCLGKRTRIFNHLIDDFDSCDSAMLKIRSDIPLIRKSYVKYKT